MSDAEKRLRELVKENMRETVVYVCSPAGVLVGEQGEPWPPNETRDGHPGDCFACPRCDATPFRLLPAADYEAQQAALREAETALRYIMRRIETQKPSPHGYFEIIDKIVKALAAVRKALKEEK